jgi:membrane protease YdiL (CAAX protease family)
VTGASNAKATWSIWSAVLLGISGSLTYLVLLFLLSQKGRALGIPPWSSYRGLMTSTLLALLGTCVIFAPIMFATARIQGIENLRDSIEWNLNRNAYRWFFAGAVLAFAYRTVLRLAFGSSGSFSEHPYLLSMGLYVVSVLLLQPFVEEVYFRGILFVALAGKLGANLGIGVVTLLFVLLHPGHRLNVLPVGIALAVARLKTKSVASCFVFHSSYNLFLALYQLAAPS